MILQFKNYTITVAISTDGYLSLSVTPELLEADKSGYSQYILGIANDKNSEFYKLVERSRIQPKKDEYTKTINTIYQERIDSILNQYPPAEVTGWTTKVFQSERWLAATDGERTQLLRELPMLIAEAGSNDFAVITDLATRIKRKSDAYQLYHGEQTRIRYDLLDRLELVDTQAKLDEFKIYMDKILTLG